MKKVNPNISQVSNLKNSTAGSDTNGVNNVTVVDPTATKSIDNSNKGNLEKSQN